MTEPQLDPFRPNTEGIGADVEPPVGERVTFEIDGVLRSQQSAAEEDPQRQCLCCRPRAHVFAYGVALPFEVAGPRGPLAASPSDWISRVLRDHRFEGGRKVRLTLTLLDPASEAP